MDSLKEIWNIYIDSFPEDERRSIELQKEALKKPGYNLIPILIGEKIIGFMATWDLDDFIFIEHYAINQKYRGRGYGRKFLKSMLNKCKKKLVLEVERPTTDIAKRRIKFYQGLNFHLNHFRYIQPPYDRSKKPISLMIMTYPGPIDQGEFYEIKDRLYNTVYEVDKEYR